MISIFRRAPRLYRSIVSEAHSTSTNNINPFSHRDPPSSDTLPGGTRPISIIHPKDAAGSSSNQSSFPPPPHPPSSTILAGEQHDEHEYISDVPSTIPIPVSRPPTYSHPPFHTHAFFVALEKTFPTSTAQSLMRATRALLVDRVGRVRREGLTAKDLDNQAYLLRAALSELRQEVQTQIKNDAGVMSAGTRQIRREVDKLEAKMRDDINTLKHEVQMDVDSRRNEAKDEFKEHDIRMEDMLSTALVDISELRTLVEENKWHNMRRAVITLFSFVLCTILALELQLEKPKPPKQSVASTLVAPMSAPSTTINQGDTMEKMDWGT